MYVLSDLYDADRRVTDPTVRRLSQQQIIPHPLGNVRYADGMFRCTHAKKHKPHQPCNSREVIVR